MAGKGHMILRQCEGLSLSMTIWHLGGNNGDRVVSTLSLSMESLMVVDSRMDTGRAFPVVLRALTGEGEGGLGNEEELWAVVESFATENLKGEKEKGLGVHVSSLCQNIDWLLCTAIVQLPSAVLFPLFPSCLFSRAPWIVLIVSTAN